MLSRERKSIVILIGGWLALGQSGCVLGPTVLKASRAPYNQVIQQTTGEQLLLNLVRLKYRESPVFLEVGSVSAQFVFDRSAEISGTLNENIPMQPLNPDVLRIGAGVKYQERPTITYAPLQGKDFVNRLMSPLPIETVLLLTRTGWRIDRVLPLTVESINGLDNARGASGPTPIRKPNYEDFFQLAALLGELQDRGVLELGAQAKRETLSDPIAAAALRASDLVAAAQAGYQFRSTDQGRTFVLNGSTSSLLWRVPPSSDDANTTDGIRSRLALDPEQGQYTITPGDGTSRKALRGQPLNHSINISTRSLMGIMFYLSHAVEAPPHHVEQGLVTQTLDEKGRPFDWNKVTGGLFRVHSSARAPKRAAVAVRYRRTWYYIDDADLSTKSTFTLLGQLFALQAGEAATTAPILTLPVGG